MHIFFGDLWAHRWWQRVDRGLQGLLALEKWHLLHLLLLVLIPALVSTRPTVVDITVKTAESVVAGVVELGAVVQVSGEGVGVDFPT